MYVHAGSLSSLIVYVDSILMIASATDGPRLWADIDRDTQLQAPPAGMKHDLGARCRMTPYDMVHPLKERMLAVGMVDYTRKAVDRFKAECGAPLSKARTPFLPGQDWGSPLSEVGAFAHSCSSCVATLLFLSRVCRPDVSAAVRRLCTAEPRWERVHDKALAKLFATYTVVGTLAPMGAKDVIIRAFTDADFNGASETTRSTIGVYIEAYSPSFGRFWPTFMGEPEARLHRLVHMRGGDHSTVNKPQIRRHCRAEHAEGDPGRAGPPHGRDGQHPGGLRRSPLPTRATARSRGTLPGRSTSAWVLGVGVEHGRSEDQKADGFTKNPAMHMFLAARSIVGVEPEDVIMGMAMRETQAHKVRVVGCGGDFKA